MASAKVRRDIALTALDEYGNSFGIQIPLQNFFTMLYYNLKNSDNLMYGNPAITVGVQFLLGNITTITRIDVLYRDKTEKDVEKENQQESKRLKAIREELKKDEEPEEEVEEEKKDEPNPENPDEFRPPELPSPPEPEKKDDEEEEELDLSVPEGWQDIFKPFAEGVTAYGLRVWFDAPLDIEYSLNIVDQHAAKVIEIIAKNTMYVEDQEGLDNIMDMYEKELDEC